MLLEKLSEYGIKLYSYVDGELRRLGSNDSLENVKSLAAAVDEVKDAVDQVRVVSDSKGELLKIKQAEVIKFSSRNAKTRLKNNLSDSSLLLDIILSFAGTVEDKKQIDDNYEGIDRPFICQGSIYELNIEYVISHDKNIVQSLIDVATHLKSAIKKLAARRAIDSAA